MLGRASDELEPARPGSERSEGTWGMGEAARAGVLGGEASSRDSARCEGRLATASGCMSMRTTPSALEQSTRRDP